MNPIKTLGMAVIGTLLYKKLKSQGFSALAFHYYYLN